MNKIVLIGIVLLTSCQSVKETKSNAIGNNIISVGVKDFRWTDSERVDEYYGGRRLINIRMWYPSVLSIGEDNYQRPSYYYEIADVYKRLGNWSEEDYQAVSNIEVHSRVNPPFRNEEKKYPILLLSPSLGGNISQYTYYAEALANSGFVVVGVNHLFESEYVLDDKNKLYASNLTFHDSLKTLDIPKQITADKYREVKGVRQAVLGQDLVFCLDKLAEMNKLEFGGRLDMEKVGAFGHSIGGAASVYASILDERFKAILDIDGTPPTVALQNGIKVPFMFIEDLTDYKNHIGYKKLHARRNAFCKLNSADSYRILIGDTNHNSFLDINYHMAQNAKEKQKAMADLIKTEGYINQFFSHFLKNADLDLGSSRTDTLEIIKFLKN